MSSDRTANSAALKVANEANAASTTPYLTGWEASDNYLDLRSARFY